MKTFAKLAGAFVVGLLLALPLGTLADIDLLTDLGGFSAQQAQGLRDTFAYQKAQNETVTAANTITADESGTTFFLNSATEFASTLPAPAAGLNYTFIVDAPPSSASYTIVTNGSSNIITILVNELETDTMDDGPYDDDADTITFADGVAVKGDWVYCMSDGTDWFCRGATNADGGITTATDA